MVFPRDVKISIQCGIHGIGQAAVYAHSRRAADIDPRLMNGFVDGHSVIHQKGDKLQHGRHDPPAAGRAHRHAQAVRGFNNGRAHVAERPLARAD